MTGIFDAKAPLDPGFEQIAELRHHREQQRDDAAIATGAERSKTIARRRTATITAPSVPPMAPDQVFFGLTAGISFGPPNARPAK